ncbi:MAG: IS30 family transposase [Moraxellaceae bacterium]|nr:MAG: IS30 family transposase [Moraxellaceae bacterium]
MTSYTHLSQEERYDISTDLNSGLSMAEIARKHKRHRSTLYRELARNKGQRGYRPKQAHDKVKGRRYQPVSTLTGFALCYISHLITGKWSPEQIHGALTACGWEDVPSHEWIYQYIYQDKARGGDLQIHLRRQKIYRKRGHKSNDRRGQLANRRSIHERDPCIDARERLGDFEGDTIIGKGHQGAVVTLVDRKSLYVIIHPLVKRTSHDTINACKNHLKRNHAYSVTFDNGKEFAEHQQLHRVGIDVHFADPYHSNQRARNENTNGLIRQYLPKAMPLDQVTVEQTNAIAEALNSRPRKSLGWLTPAQVMANFHTVALAA